MEWKKKEALEKQIEYIRKIASNFDFHIFNRLSKAEASKIICRLQNEKANNAVSNISDKVFLFTDTDTNPSKSDSDKRESE